MIDNFSSSFTFESSIIIDKSSTHDQMYEQTLIYNAANANATIKNERQAHSSIINTMANPNGVRESLGSLFVMKRTKIRRKYKKKWPKVQWKLTISSYINELTPYSFRAVKTNNSVMVCRRKYSKLETHKAPNMKQEIVFVQSSMPFEAIYYCQHFVGGKFELIFLKLLSLFRKKCRQLNQWKMSRFERNEIKFTFVDNFL